MIQRTLNFVFKTWYIFDNVNEICFSTLSNKVTITAYRKVYFDGCDGFVDTVVVNEDKLQGFVK